MKRIICNVFIGLIFCFGQKGFAQLFPVMSYNIRYDNPADGENSWDNRKADLVAMLQQTHPYILGIQEGLFQQVQYIDKALVQYKFIGVGREDGKQKGEFAAIYYDTSKLELMAGGTFWLSASGDTASTGWDAALPRICTYGLFKMIETGKQFYVFNCHFDHIGEEARLSSAKLIKKKIDALNITNYPVIWLGDFNCLPDSAPIKYITQYYDDCRVNSKFHFDENEGTFNGFDVNAEPTKRIDYMFVKKINIDMYIAIATKRKNGLWISDHLPIEAWIELL